jgi:hypothetical protein
MGIPSVEITIMVEIMGKSLINGHWNANINEKHL